MKPHSASRIPPLFWLLILTLLIAAFLRLWQLDTFPPGLQYDDPADTILADHPFAREISEKWNAGLMRALENLPLFPWEQPGGSASSDGCVMAPPRPPGAVAS